MPETKTNAPICKTQNCKKPLTYMEESNCWRCLVCNPIPIYRPVEKTRKKLVDAKMTEDEVRSIVKDELANWHIQKPPVTATEIYEAVGSVDSEPTVIKVDATPPTWRQKAKELGVPLHKEPKGSGMRKKSRSISRYRKEKKRPH